MKTPERVINAGDVSTPRKHFWQHLMFLYYWQWHALQQYIQNGLLHFYCNNG